jgi:predicted transcriptional regulator
MAEENAELSPLELATELTVAWLSNPNTRAAAEDVPTFLQQIHAAVSQLNANGSLQGQVEVEQQYTPAVTPRKSLSSPEHIISLIDGKPYKSLKRHLATHGLTPAQYRERYGLKGDYPMVAPAYAEKRRELAKKIGLGRKPAAKPTEGKQAAPSKTKASQPANAAEPAKASEPAKAKAKAATRARSAAAAKAPAKKAPRKKLGVQFDSVASGETKA